MPRVGVILALVLGSAALTIAAAQSADPQQARLQRLFPTATAFSPKGGDPPHFKAYSGGRASQTVVGYAFWTTELVPLERGYSGPIAILVGLDPTGKLTGIIVADHHEPY